MKDRMNGKADVNIRTAEKRLRAGIFVFLLVGSLLLPLLAGWEQREGMHWNRHEEVQSAAGHPGSGSSRDPFTGNHDFSTAASIEPGTYTNLDMVGRDDYYNISFTAGSSVDIRVIITNYNVDPNTMDIDLFLCGPSP